MTCIAFAYLQHLRLAEQPRTGRGKKEELSSGTATVAQSARRAEHHHRTAVRTPHPASVLPTLPAVLPPAYRPQSAKVVLERVKDQVEGDDGFGEHQFCKGDQV